MDVSTYHNITCKHCNETQFTLKEGYYYCDECDQQAENERLLVLEPNKEFGDVYIKGLKIKPIKSDLEKPNLTSWECYNYILRGFVEELISLGVSEDLKPVALQIWAAYLRKTEVAFFNKNHPELPKLNARYLKRDANILYNHKLHKDKLKRMRSRAFGQTWGKQKTNLDKSEYAALSESQYIFSVSQSGSTQNTSSTGATTRPIRIKFSSTARRHLKRSMPAAHIKKHEMDYNSNLNCHKSRNVRQIKPRENSVETLCIRHVYIVLIIALNLIETDIQISDVIRFITEGPLSVNHLSKYFPENIVPHFQETLKEINFYYYSHICEILRFHTFNFCKFLNINLVAPNFKRLVKRFVTELRLPETLVIYTERLINLLSPKMKNTSINNFLNYEARAMGYIIFTLKLLFGLDGKKERAISASSREINAKIEQLFEQNLHEKPQTLFVWNDWVEYIEMRKVILSECHNRSARIYNESQSCANFAEETRELQTAKHDMEPYPTPLKHSAESRQMNMSKIFEKFKVNYCKTNQPNKKNIEFLSCLVPCSLKLQKIIEHCRANNLNYVPKSMQIEHNIRSIQPLLDTTKLQHIFSSFNINLEVIKKGCTNHSKFVGIFRPAFRPERALLKRADFNVDDETWESSATLSTIGDLEYKDKFDFYGKITIKKIERNELNLTETSWMYPEKFVHNPIKGQNEQISNTNSLISNNIFSEEKMNFLNDENVQNSRRGLGDTFLFAKSSDDDVKNEIDVNSDYPPQVINFYTSNMDCWFLLGYLFPFSDTNKKFLKDVLPKSFFWLLEICAQLIGVDWIVLYEHLLTIETTFIYGIEPLDEFRGCIKFTPDHRVKDINIWIKYFRNEW